VLQYSVDLEQKLVNKFEVDPGSTEEVEIRAMTIQVVEKIKELCKKTAIEIDWILWQRGEKSKDTLTPHHRTLTIYY